MMIRPSTVFLFSGQGSQYYQMGRSLYLQGGTFARSMRQMDEIVREMQGCSVLESLYGDTSAALPFDDLRLSHPAIYMIEVAIGRCLLERGIEPDMTLGVSLGSVAAAVFAGSLSAEEGLAWVVRHAEWTLECSPPGGMIGVLALRSALERDIVELGGAIAAINGPSHWVVSAKERDLLAIEGLLKSRGATFGRLPVRYGFHSPWQAASCTTAGSAAPTPRLEAPRIPVACCAVAEVLSSLPGDFFWRATQKPIQFERTLQRLESSGQHRRYIDLGPSGTLATLLKYLLPSESRSTAQGILSPFGREVAALEAMEAAPPVGAA